MICCHCCLYSDRLRCLIYCIRICYRRTTDHIRICRTLFYRGRYNSRLFQPFEVKFRLNLSFNTRVNGIKVTLVFSFSQSQSHNGSTFITTRSPIPWALMLNVIGFIEALLSGHLVRVSSTSKSTLIKKNFVNYFIIYIYF